MKLSIEMTKAAGLSVSASIPTPVLQVLAPLAAGGLAAWPWLLQVARAMGWM
jgi:hypothetical protein